MSKVIKLHKKDFPVNLLEGIYGGLEPAQKEEYLSLYRNNKSDVRATLNYVLGRLEERTEKIIRMRYEQACTYNQIAKEFNISQTRPQQILAHTFRDIRHEIKLAFFFKGLKKHYAEQLEAERKYSQEMGRNEAIAAFNKLETQKEKTEYMEQHYNAYMDMPFEQFAERFELSARTRNCILRSNLTHTLKYVTGFKTVGDLTKITESEAMMIRNLGKRSLNELKTALKKVGLSFRKESSQCDS